MEELEFEEALFSNESIYYDNFCETGLNSSSNMTGSCIKFNESLSIHVVVMGILQVRREIENNETALNYKLSQRQTKF